MTDERHVVDLAFCQNFARVAARKYPGKTLAVVTVNKGKAGYETRLSADGEYVGPWITMGNTRSDQEATALKLTEALAAYAKG